MLSERSQSQKNRYYDSISVKCPQWAYPYRHMDTEHNVVIAWDWGQGGKIGRGDGEGAVIANGYGFLFGVLKGLKISCDY